MALEQPLPDGRFDRPYMVIVADSYQGCRVEAKIAAIG
jgi:hypothetical protein